jgi:hypothetical protein
MQNTPENGPVERVSGFGPERPAWAFQAPGPACDTVVWHGLASSSDIGS